MTAAPTTTELRCSAAGSSTLFMKLITEGHAVADNRTLIEVSCVDCRRAMNPRPRHVLHRFNLQGEAVETVIVPADDNRRP